MKLKEYDIVIEPREIIFEHIQPNKKFTKTINIKNVGNKSKRMELFRPSNKVFKLDFVNPTLPVPPGMEIAAKVNFETTNSQDYNDKMIVSIDNNEIEIPIQAFPAKPILKVDEKVNFGTQSASNKTISASLKISNIGAVDGEFTINYKGNLPITFAPSKDIIPAYSDAFIRVDFFTKFATKVEEKAEINLKGSDKPLTFKILANVMEKQLILLDSEKNEPINRIDFGSCYYGCNLTNLAILFNSSPEKVDYVILLEENGIGAEIGAEFSKSTKALKASQNDYKEEDFCPLNKLITAFPNNGSLEPFEKRPIFFRFSPEFISPRLGFNTTLKAPQRRDYAVFLYIEQVGDHKKSELAITGTALPVLLRAEPNKLDFSTCEIGQKRDLAIVLLNDSELKPVRFKFRKIANYIVNPASGCILPRQQKTITISFVPNQIGAFKYNLPCEVIDKMVDKENPLLIQDRGITEIPIYLSGNAVELKKGAIPKYSGGIEPVLTNEVGLNVNTTVETLQAFVPKAAVQNAPNDHLHKVSYAEKIKPGNAAQYKIAFPNDRSKSIGPYNKNEKYKTIFTGLDRYNYVDPDYAYTDKEQEKYERHKQIYKQYLKSLKYNRFEKIRKDEFSQFDNPKDIGITPGGGLKPQELTLKDMYKEANKKPDFVNNNDWKLISSEDMISQQRKIDEAKENASRLNSLTVREKEKLNIQLTPAQIYKILINPSVIDFGEVCIKSVSSKTLEIFNSLDQPIHIELENDCNELRQTTPLSQVIQPQSKGTFSIVFESEYVQTFQRSISYRINYSYRHHIIVLAECKLQSLKLNKSHAVLNQLLDIQPELCYRTNITVINPYNAITEFTWMPIYGEQGTAY